MVDERRRAGTMPHGDRHRRHHHLRHAVHGGSFPPDPADPRSATGLVRRAGLRLVGQRGGPTDPPRPPLDGQHRRSLGAAQEAPWDQGAPAGRFATDGDVAASAAHPSPRSRHGAGPPRLLPDPAILARRVAGQSRQHGAPARAPLRRRTPAQPPRGRQPGSADRVSRCRLVPSAARGQGRHPGRDVARTRACEGHGRPAADAIVHPRRQQRAL